MKRLLLCPVVLAILLAGPCAELKACGINFSLPTFHFSHVNDQGKFSYWEKIGQIDVGRGLILPLHLNFSADRHSVSPTLNARSFLLGLTDASAVQLDERKFRIYTPAGRYRTFTRDKKNPSVLHSGDNWKGEIKGDVLSVASNCGDRLIYHQGVLSQMQLKDRKFDFVRSGRSVTEIREGGKTILNVITDPAGESLKLKFGLGKEINFQFEERPIVQVIGGQNMVARKERSVHVVTKENGDVRSFSFAVDQKLQPTMKVENRQFTWNAETGHILADDDWAYQITTGENEFSNAAIARATADGKKEFWHEDRAEGVETVESVDGIKHVTTRFRKGMMANKKRKQDQFKDGKLVSSTAWSYDEKGVLVRETSNGKTISFVYDDKNRLSKKLDEDKTALYEASYDESGRLESEAVPGSYRKKITYLKDGGRREEIFREDPNRVESTREINGDGYLVMFTDKNGYEYRRKYDDRGKLEAIFQEGRLRTKFEYNSRGQIDREINYAGDGFTVLNLKQAAEGSLNLGKSPQYVWKLASQLDSSTRENLGQEAKRVAENFYKSL